MKRIGLFGGSFNPAHGGHRRMSIHAARRLELDEIWWLVSPGNPLKDPTHMAPLGARFASARRAARRLPIRVTALERQLGSPYTIDTLRALRRRFPRARFIWLMGADNLAQLHRWRDWRGLARLMPIAVVARPGYDSAALASPAMAWLGRHRVSAASLKHRGEWSAPALVILRFDPDSRSATAIRRADPEWADRFPTNHLRDQVTHRPIGAREEPTAP